VPGIGAADLRYHTENGTIADSISIPLAVSNNGNGGIILVGQATYFPFDNLGLAAPVDTRGTIYNKVVADAPYRGYPSVGNAVFSASVGSGNGPLTITIKKSIAAGEITVNAVHIPNGTKVTAAPRTYPSAGSGVQRSGSVTTNGPAVLVAWWWGDGSLGTTHVANPANGFQIISALTLDGNIVQCTVAVKVVSAAGTYDAAWFSTSGEGAMLALVAVE
jgi:hypothetical protein